MLPDYVYSKAKDYWGYYNNQNGSNSLIPRTLINIKNALGSDDATQYVGSNIDNNREPDNVSNQAYILNKIHLPTGGLTKFDYETNQYLDLNVTPNAVKYAGGLRVKQISYYDREGGPLLTKKTYKYGIGETGIGRIIIPVSNKFFLTEQRRYPEPGTQDESCRIRTYCSVPNISFEPYDETPVGYEQVTEYTGDETSNTGKIVYNYNFVSDMFTSMYAYNKPNIVSNHFRRGLLRDKNEFIKLSNGTYKSIHQIHNDYEAFPENTEGAVDLVVFEKTIWDDYHNPNGQPRFTWNSYSVMEGDDKLIKTTETFNNTANNNTLTNITEFTYGNFNHQQPTSIKKYLSDSYEITSLKYPHDFISTPPYDKMVQANIISPPVEKEIFRNTASTSLLQTNYKEWFSNHYLPETIKYRTKNNTLEPRAQFFSYDINSNPLQVSKTDDVVTSYIWDYKNTYAIAQVINASQSDIAYTSFEADGTGSWSNVNQANILSDVKAVSGTNLYNFNSTALSKSGLNSSSTYIVSYWSNSGVYSVSGASVSGWPKSLRSVVINGVTWSLWEHKIRETETVSVSGAGSIDELRLYPANAQMTTYTYKLLTGLSSVSDINNNISYYEYDTFGRLKLIRDLKGNITKTFNYKYQSVTP